MSEHEKKAFESVADVASKLANAADEGTVLAITASYLAGKEAGKREAQTAAQI